MVNEHVQNLLNELSEAHRVQADLYKRLSGTYESKDYYHTKSIELESEKRKLERHLDSFYQKDRELELKVATLKKEIDFLKGECLDYANFLLEFDSDVVSVLLKLLSDNSSVEPNDIKSSKLYDIINLVKRLNEKVEELEEGST